MEPTRKKITQEQYRQILMEILKYFDKFCKDNGLTYFLSDGTLLGAIRHHGMIPWDDDIDVDMPRPDYNKLKKLFVGQGNYVLALPGEACRSYHLKIYDKRTIKIEDGIQYHDDYLGVDIDIFPIDGSSPEQEEYEKDRILIKKIYTRYTTVCCGFAGPLWYKVEIALFKLLFGKAKKLLAEADRLCEKYSYDDSPFATRYGRFSLGFRVDKNCYSKAILKPFEGEMLPVPAGYDQILKAQFGNYMIPPPEAQQKTHHNNKIYWK